MPEASKPRPIFNALSDGGRVNSPDGAREWWVQHTSNDAILGYYPSEQAAKEAIALNVGGAELLELAEVH